MKCTAASYECALPGGINNLYFGHRHAVGKLHYTVWLYKVRWSFPSHFPSRLNTLLMPARILLSLSLQVNCLSYNLQRHIFCNKHGTLINKTNKNTPLPCYKPNIKLQTCKMFKCKKIKTDNHQMPYVAPNE